MPQLPYDIWNRIVSYLPVEQTKKLYSVNGALFDIAMDLRYQEARLGAGGTKARVRKDMRVFRHPHLSCRPKILHIDLGSIGKSLSPLDKEIPSFGQGILNLIVTGQYQIDSVFEIALDAFPRLTAVTKLSVVFHYTGAWRDDPSIRQLITHLWQFLGDRLRFLQLQVALENLELLLPTSLHLPNLAVLAIDAGGYSRIAASTAESIVSTILQSHSSSLCDVSFTTKNIALDLQHIFRSLQCLPCLRALHLFLPLLPRPFPVYELLYSCRHRLEVLSLNFGTNKYEGTNITMPDSSLFCEGWSCVDLPRVRDLRIDLPVLAFGQEFFDYIYRFAPSLISLSINSHPELRYRQAEQLSSIFHDFFSLQNLSICICYLCPDILALLARTIPHLQTLNLRYVRISSTTDLQLLDVPEITRLFYPAMQQHASLFRDWQLVSLDYASFSVRSESVPIEKALTDHLPNIEWFCGLERSAYLARAQNLRPTRSSLSPAAMPLGILSSAGRFINSLTYTD